MEQEKRNILVVDNDVAVGNLLIRVFKMELGWDIEYVPDGELALAMWRKNKHDLIITDLDRPRLDGEELISIMQQEDPDVKIIVLSGYKPKTIKGVLRVFGKPIQDICGFARRVKEIILETEATCPA